VWGAEASGTTATLTSVWASPALSLVVAVRERSIYRLYGVRDRAKVAVVWEDVDMAKLQKVLNARAEAAKNSRIPRRQGGGVMVKKSSILMPPS
jgi:hypothetical protein